MLQQYVQKNAEYLHMIQQDGTLYMEGYNKKKIK